MRVRTHILREASPHARGRFVSPLRVSLVCDVCTQAVRRRASGLPFSTCRRNFCAARFACIPCAMISSHEEAAPHTTKNFIVVCGSASVFATREQRGAAVRRDAKRVREYRQAHRPCPAFVAGQFVRAALYLCGLLLTRSPAPRRDVVRPLEKEPVRFPQNRRRRGGLTRPAVCTVPAACRSVAFLLVASAQGITN